MSDELMLSDIYSLIALAKTGDSDSIAKLEFWKGVMKLNPKHLKDIDDGLYSGKLSILDEQISYALATANAGRTFRTLSLVKVAQACKDFIEKPFFREKGHHWVVAAQFKSKDPQEAKTALFNIVREGEICFLNIAAVTRETLIAETSKKGNLSTPSQILKNWADSVLSKV